MKRHVIILAGGIGSRFNEKQPKQYFKNTKGFSSIELSVKPFLDFDIQSYIFVCGIEYQDEISDLFKDKINSNIYFAEAGNNRQESIDKGIWRIREEFKIGDEDQVLIQESVRPFVSKKLVKRLLDSPKENIAVAPCITPPELFCFINKGKQNTNTLIEKEELGCLQLPRRYNLSRFIDFRYSIIDEAEDILDESVLFLENSIPLSLIEGSYENIKITFPEHKILLEHYYDIKK